MKKILLTILAATPLLFTACSTDDSSDKGEGSIVITTAVDNTTTRATSTDPADFFATLTGPSTRNNVPIGDGVITGLIMGTYNISVASHQTMPGAAFDSRYYFGEATGVLVNAGEETAVNITASIANAGIKFDYAAALATAGITVVPTVVGTNGTLVYEGANKDAEGYFAPGEVTITLKDGNGNALPIEGNASATVALAAGELVTAELKYTATETGSITLNVTVDVTTIPKEITFNVTEGEGGGDEITLDTFVGNYSVVGTIANWSSTVGAPSWSTAISKGTTQQGEEILITSGYGGTTVRFPMRIVDGKLVLAYDISTAATTGNTHYGLFKLLYRFTYEGENYVGTIPDAEVEEICTAQWDDATKTISFKDMKYWVEYSNQYEDVFMVCRAFNSSTNAADGTFTDGYYNTIYTGTATGGAIAPNAYNSVEVNRVDMQALLQNAKPASELAK